MNMLYSDIPVAPVASGELSTLPGRYEISRAQVAAAYDNIDRNIQAILNNKGIKDGKDYNAYFELAHQTDGARAVFMAIASNWSWVCDWCFDEEKARRYFEP